MTEELYTHIKELAPFKIEYVDENDNYHKLSSYVKALYDDYILISPPENNGAFYTIKNNTTVNLIFTLDNGIFIAQCLISGKELGRNCGIKVSYPVNTRTLERREYIRVPAKLKVELTYYMDKEYIDKKTFSATTRNISGSGICIYHKEDINNYYDIECKIYLNDDNRQPIITKCDLMYSKKVKIKNEIYNMTALSYASISEINSSRIVKECFKYQINHKKLKHY